MFDESVKSLLITSPGALERANNSTVVRDGGTTRIQMNPKGQPQDQNIEKPTTAFRDAQMKGITHFSIQMGAGPNGEPAYKEGDGSIKVTSADYMRNTGSALDTLKTPNGSRLTDMSNLTNDCRVTIGRMETTVGAAVAMGLLSRDAQGNLIDPSFQQAQGNQGQQGQEEPKAGSNQVVVDLAGKSRQTLNALTSRYGQQTTNNLIAKAVDMATSDNGKIDHQLLGMISSDFKVNGLDVVNTILADFRDNANKFGKEKLKLPMDQMIEYLHSDTVSARYRRSWYHRIALNDLSAFKELHQHFARGTKNL